jgi:hypothetical protein
MNLRTVVATRYVTPLREGGSLPAIIEADDDGMYVLKFRGAGQGVKALIAELIVGEIGRVLGLLVPEIVFVELDPDLAGSEPDPEIQELLRASGGLNLGFDYLPGSITFDPLVDQPSAELASSIVWLDGFTTNVDRTPRNPNMLMWHNRLWLIDHGAALYFHHGTTDYLARSRRPFPLIKEHILLPVATRVAEVDPELSSRLTPERLHAIVDLIPDVWLPPEPGLENPQDHKRAYAEYLLARLQAPRIFVEEATDAGSKHV